MLEAGAVLEEPAATQQTQDADALEQAGKLEVVGLSRLGLQEDLQRVEGEAPVLPPSREP